MGLGSAAAIPPPPLVSIARWATGQLSRGGRTTNQDSLPETCSPDIRWRGGVEIFIFRSLLVFWAIALGFFVTSKTTFRPEFVPKK